MEVSARRNFLVGGLGKTDQAGVTPGETTGLLDEERIWLSMPENLKDTCTDAR
jgi:hypothetical protein